MASQLRGATLWPQRIERRPENIAMFGVVVGIALLLAGIGFMILALGGALRPQQVDAEARSAAGSTTAAPATH